MDKQFIRVIPFYSKPIVGEPELEPPMPVALWKCRRNCCEGSDSRCDDSEGLYYSIAGDAVTFWCPRHWYEAHYGTNAGQRLVDMTDEEFRQECAEQKQRFTKEWEIVSGRLKAAANILNGAGLPEEAGKIWEVHGWIRSSIDSLCFYPLPNE